MLHTNNKEVQEWSSDLRQLIGEVVITMGTEKGEKLVAEIKNKVHQELQKVRHDWLREEIVKLEGMKFPNDTVDEDMYYKKEGRNNAIEQIIHRYQSELDQPK